MIRFLSKSLRSFQRQTVKTILTIFPDSSFFRNGRFYTVDSLQAGCYPIYKQRIVLNLKDKDNDTYEQAIDLPGIEKISGNPGLFEYSNGVIFPYTDRLKQPDQISFRIRTESGHLYLDQEYTLNVMDQQNDPEWVMPKDAVVWYAEPGEPVSGPAIASKVTDLDPYKPLLYAETDKPNEGLNGDSVFVYNNPDTYNLYLKLDWGSFFTVTNVTLLVYPKDE